MKGGLSWRASALLPAIVVGLAAPGAGAVEGPTRPSILLIPADDLGFSDLGCYGGEIATPNLDRLARTGLRFRQTYNCAVCVPTRASLLSYAGYGLHWANVSNTPFPLDKTWTNEGGIATPLIVSWPGRVAKGGGFRDDVVHVMDIAPTLREAVGARYPVEFKERRLDGCSGRSLLPSLRGMPRVAGAYPVQVSSADGSAGSVLVEIHEVPQLNVFLARRGGGDFDRGPFPDENSRRRQNLTQGSRLSAPTAGL